MMLKQAFDETQPKTMRQWWYDSRNGVQWYTFWVAMLVLVLTVVFGLVQSIEGALQVYAHIQGTEHREQLGCRLENSEEGIWHLPPFHLLRCLH